MKMGNVQKRELKLKPKNTEVRKRV